MKHHLVYKIINGFNGMYYYGIHSTNNINDDYMGSGRLLRKAIKEEGIDNFTKKYYSFSKTEKKHL